LQSHVNKLSTVDFIQRRKRKPPKGNMMKK
jgi:hypothetical protein